MILQESRSRTYAQDPSGQDEIHLVRMIRMIRMIMK